MLQNNFSISQLLGIIIGSPSLFGIGGIIYNIIYIDPSQSEEDMAIFIFIIAFTLTLLVGAVGLYLHKLWGRTLSTICISLTILALVIMLIAVLPGGDHDLPLLIGFVGSGLVFCVGVLFFLYNQRVTKELRNGRYSIFNDEILDSHFH